MKNNLDSILPTKAIVAVPDRSRQQRRLTAIFWLVALVLGALHAWASRHDSNDDGVSYLDMGDAYFQGDWNMAINAYWSPFYSWLLGLAMRILSPPPYWEFSVVHLVNFAIYLVALGCFHFFLRELIHSQGDEAARLAEERRVNLPEWAWLALGYTLFIWSSLKMITVRIVTPDMCVAAFVYLAGGIVLRIRRASASWPTFVLFGVVLGLGYLAKAAMFPLAFIFLGVSLFAGGTLRKAMPRVLIALLVFLSVGGPFVVALSTTKGRLTFGDSGKLNYAWYVNDIPGLHWQGEPPGSGTPRHPTRKIFDVPAIYEFGTPIGGTIPLWYDPSYWNEGLTPHFDLRRQIRALVRSARVYYDLFFEQQGVLIAGFLILLTMGRRRWRCVNDLAEHWSLLIPAIAASGMYSLVGASPRMIAAFVVLFWAGLFSSVVLPDSQESRRLVAGVTIAIVVVLMTTVGAITVRKAYSTYCDLTEGEDASAHIQWQVADVLNRMGVQPGEKVAIIGDGKTQSHWARLARVRIVAEIPHFGVVREKDKFWAADDSVKSEVIKTLARTGAKAIVADGRIYASTFGWQRIGNTDYYAYLLPR